MIGTLIENYKILEKLNADETIGVFKAVDETLKRNVLIKILNRESSRQASAAGNFRREAETLAQIAHPCVPVLHRLTTVNERLCMILEFLDGETLDESARRQGKISPEKAVEIFSQIFDSLAFAHASGNSHGSLEISKIFLSETGAVKILDFGKQGNVFSESVAPKEFNAGADVFAVGKMLFEVLTGEIIADDKVQGAENRLRFVHPVLPETLVKFVGGILSAQSENDSRSAADLRGELLRTISNHDESLEKPAIAEDEICAGKNEKTSAAVYLDFSSNDRKPRKNAFRRKWMKKSAERKTADTSIGWDLVRKNYWVAGAGILAILVLHLFFQISFVQNQAVQTVEKLPIVESQTEELTETMPMPETDDEAKIEARYNLPNADAEIKSKSAAPILKLKTAPASVPLKHKDSPTPAAAAAAREARAERLRRVEKMLTGV